MTTKLRAFWPRRLFIHAYYQNPDPLIHDFLLCRHSESGVDQVQSCLRICGGEMSIPAHPTGWLARLASYGRKKSLGGKLEGASSGEGKATASSDLMMRENVFCRQSPDAGLSPNGKCRITYQSYSGRQGCQDRQTCSRVSALGSSPCHG